jgi:hypothetical protein
MTTTAISKENDMAKVSKKDRILAYIEKHPKAKITSVAKATNTTYGYAHSVLLKAGKIKITRPRKAKVDPNRGMPQLDMIEVNNAPKKGFFARLFGF